MWMTLEEVAVYLKVSRETVYKLAQQHRLPASKVGNQWRFKKELVDDWLTKGTEAAAPQIPTIEANTKNQSRSIL